MLVWRWGRAGVWVLLCGVMRYAFVAAGWLLPWMARPLTPTLRGRAICVVQIVSLGIAIAPFIPPALAFTAALVAVLSLTGSFAIDVLWLWRAREP